MLIGKINMLAVLVAAVLSFAFGGVWYNLLSKHWMEASGRTPESLGKEGVGLYIITFLAQALMAALLAGALHVLGGSGPAPGLVTGMITSTFLWFGFVLPTMTVNYAYHGAPIKLTLIDGGHWLCVLLLQGAIIGWWR